MQSPAIVGNSLTSIIRIAAWPPPPTYYKSKFTAESDCSAVKTIQDKIESTSIKALDGE